MVRYYIEYTLEEKLEMKKKGEKQFNRIIPRAEVYNRLEQNPNYYKEIERKNEKLIQQGSRYRYQLIPCKHCYACRLNYSAEWATRIMLECKEHENNYFVTLTYNDESLRINKRITYTDQDGNKQTIENDGSFIPTLEPRDLKTFINSLRKYFERKGHIGIKYYAAGEYGELNGRPHFHIILMNCPLNPFDFYNTWIDENHKEHYHSKELDRIWKKGIIDVAAVEWSSAAYVARYGTKSLLNYASEEEYAKKGIIKEFVRMSTRPPIGLGYYNNNVIDILETDEIIMKTVKGNIGRVKPPKYFDRKNEDLYPEYMETVKENRRQAAERANKIIQNATNVSDKELYEREANKLLSKSKMLKRTHTEEERLIKNLSH